ncbi:MAG TPA: glycoside hydrolase family 3 N-terminal domain-containing protein [Chitinophagaceae bacterium]|nr:glycoside hydrolase family 3 N-terminal domain-containing protein [Chitinophagaceae bacterium]
MKIISKYILLLGGVLSLAETCDVPAGSQRSFKETSGYARGIDHRVDSLLAKMSLEEKVGQLSLFGSDKKNLKELIKKGLIGGTNGMLPGRENVSGYLKQLQELALQSRLKIPLFFMGDVIHGYRTTFPVPIAEACAWDPALVRETDSIAAMEATSDGMNWTFAPMVDIARDPRWGRVMEGAGEDPFLGARLAAAAVHGFQGNDLSDPHRMLATAKHFAAYGAVEGGRDYNTVDMSGRRLRQIYLPPFQAAIDAGVGSIMPAFISLNGIPASENRHLLTTILRNDCGFKGLVVSDYDAVPELLEHGVAPDTTSTVAEAIGAGMNMDLHSGAYLANLPALIRKGRVSEATLNAAVSHVLALKFRLGLFKNPFKGATHGPLYEDTLLKKHRSFALKAAERSIVLLKNEGHLLPLSRKTKTLAVIGPLAKDRQNLLGPVHAVGRWQDAISAFQSITEAVSPDTKILYARGTGIADSSIAGFAGALSVARQADVVIMVMGESAGMSGEGDSRSVLGLPGNQLDLVKAVIKAGKPVVVVLMNGRPLTIDWLDQHVPGILETWFLGTEAGPAIANVLFGDYNPSGKLPISFPRNTGQIPVYYNHLNTGRPLKAGNKYTSRYIDIPNTPLYPFGYGLSYTAFTFSDPQLSTQVLGWNDTLNISVKLTNTGEWSGTEVAQLYIRDLVASISRPVKELKGFRRIHLAPGQTTTVSFTLCRNDLRFYGKDMRYLAEPGDFEVFVGGSSAVVNHARFTLKKPGG